MAKNKNGCDKIAFSVSLQRLLINRHDFCFPDTTMESFPNIMELFIFQKP